MTHPLLIGRSRDKVVECFLARRTHASLDGSFHTNGTTLCVWGGHVAFWHQGVVYLVPKELPTSQVKDVQATIRLGTHGHTVAEVGVDA